MSTEDETDYEKNRQAFWSTIRKMTTGHPDFREQLRKNPRMFDTVKTCECCGQPTPKR